MLYEDPLLMGRVAHVWIRSSNLTVPGGARDKRDLINRMRFLVAGLPPGSDSLQQRENEMLEQVSTMMNVHENFVKQGIVRRVLSSLDSSSLESRDRYNAETALSTAPFREYLGLLVLSSLLQEVR